MCFEENIDRKIERLEDERSLLDEQFKLILKKIQTLKISHINASDTNVKFSLEADITESEKQDKELKEKLEQIEQKIDCLKRKKKELQKHENAQPDNTDFKKNNVEKLHNALLNLNFAEQVTLFREFIELHSVGAWIIHGERDYGQRWLLNRLMQLITVKAKTPAKVIKIGLSDISFSKKDKAIWYEISKGFGLEKESPQNIIIETIHQCRQTQNVILIFHRVDIMPKGWMHRLMNNFWKQLLGESYQDSKDSQKLLMFLVDEGGCVEKEKEWNQLSITVTTVTDDSFQNHWKPHLPIKLPLIQKISCLDLTQWKKNHINWLSLSLINRDESGIQSLLDECEDGLPQLVLEAICEECNHEWYDTENIWLKY
jgi:hypothetical protein